MLVHAYRAKEMVRVQVKECDLAVDENAQHQLQGCHNQLGGVSRNRPEHVLQGLV
jgi:hypothetical protein